MFVEKTRLIQIFRVSSEYNISKYINVKIFITCYNIFLKNSVSTLEHFQNLCNVPILYSKAFETCNK